MILSIAHFQTLLSVPLISVIKDDQANFGASAELLGKRLERLYEYMRLTDGKGQTVSAARRLGVVLQGAAIETLHRLHNTTTVMYYTIYTVGSLNI